MSSGMQGKGAEAIAKDWLERVQVRWRGVEASGQTHSHKTHTHVQAHVLTYFPGQALVLQVAMSNIHEAGQASAAGTASKKRKPCPKGGRDAGARSCAGQASACMCTVSRQAAQLDGPRRKQRPHVSICCCIVSQSPTQRRHGKQHNWLVHNRSPCPVAHALVKRNTKETCKH